MNLIDVYAEKENMYPLPEMMDGAGTVKDPETGCVLAVGFVQKQDTYHKTGFICSGNVPRELTASVCAMLELIQDMPLIRTRLLTPDDITEKICGEEEVSEHLKRYSAMALVALCQAFAGFVRSCVNDPECK